MKNIPRYLIGFNTKDLEQRSSDLLIIGSGIAGLTAAIKSYQKYKVTLLTKGELKETATWYAQGGVATAMSEKDSPELHYQDTMKAGAGLCDPEAVKALVNEARESIDDLIKLGVNFDKALSGKIELAREGGHSLSRILHSEDSTGSEIQSTLVSKVKSCQDIQIKENTFVLDFLTHKNRCIGAIVLEPGEKNPVVYFAKAVILATGGCGQLYKVTTSPSVATGDGIAMGYRAGAGVCDMEFIQFHPTGLYDKESPRFLITEALRGEGAYLRDCAGNRFMLGIHPLAELAPRDIVVREIVKAMKRCGEDHVYLDTTHISVEKLKKRFPMIYKRCKKSGFNLGKDMIPVSPVAHYMMGGVKTDTFGRTSLPGLYASGETACTGIHGANRLASNSLLEGLVFSRRICKILEDDIGKISKESIFNINLAYDFSGEKKDVDVDKHKELLREIMTSFVGVVRTKEGLRGALKKISSLENEIFKIKFDEVGGFELQNMLTVAKLITQAALIREESRGAHFRSDFPKNDDSKWKKHIILKRGLETPIYSKV
ncbi:L-aspartate oxidase [Candidatus Oleimmundimicrobium sp.]|uniref:L-aspartate oxidase n=1 Tax=Candidatus Oleimmundimicrobium sp. TaxID=3060597 RepID=UPI00271E8047|nr:L-aspartate oxidase [Candidatus Oleimmundimicrobium sp.]MDO8885658.1 L-aspartate oxidase [Candidatus Oleimmundimicrobium sp.]